MGVEVEHILQENICIVAEGVSLVLTDGGRRVLYIGKVSLLSSEKSRRIDEHILNLPSLGVQVPLHATWRQRYI